ncbi:hypothetical protein M885DRAFT_517193 [Pelagophyceae sp. CCMP2097]|nr:hypothetical protein M885DRAFT_517193 [Pelagophyceae sp. CCMP2097]
MARGSSSSDSSSSSSSEDDKTRKKPNNDRAKRYRGNRAADKKALRIAMDRFIVGYRLDGHAAGRLLELNCCARRAVLAEGPLDGRSLVAVLVSRVKRLPPQDVMDRNYKTPPVSPSREADAVAYEADPEARQRLVQAKVAEYLAHYRLVGDDAPVILDSDSDSSESARKPKRSSARRRKRSASSDSGDRKKRRSRKPRKRSSRSDESSDEDRKKSKKSSRRKKSSKESSKEKSSKESSKESSKDKTKDASD